ncbi:MAG: glycosyltransferase, partial [Burkholderiaceae bacterium]|nr:glycosyltransferase [Burkholderiaceae bacterium]
LPALSSGELIFASLNNLSKINPAVVMLWGRILNALPQARLMLGNVTDSGVEQRLIQMFGLVGIGPERLILQPRLSMAGYLALHNRIDMALDPFPYNGGTTTMHSLWMGVPVITLAGDHAVSRLCTAHLSRVGLNEFISHSEEDYFQCALRFAHDLPALNRVRQSLRERMNAAECQPSSITRHLEAAYRDMWRKWCTE